MDGGTRVPRGQQRRRCALRQAKSAAKQSQRQHDTRQATHEQFSAEPIRALKEGEKGRGMEEILWKWRQDKVR